MFISNDCLDPPFSLPTQATWLKPLHQTLPMLAPDHVFRKVYRTIGGFQSLSTSIRSSCSQASLVFLVLCKVVGDSSDFNGFLAVRVAAGLVSPKELGFGSLVISLVKYHFRAMDNGRTGGEVEKFMIEKRPFAAKTSRTLKKTYKQSYVPT